LTSPRHSSELSSQTQETLESLEKKPMKCEQSERHYVAIGAVLPKKNTILDSLFIKDYGDGGSKNDKFIRDIRLLTNGLIEEPNNARYMFYLANSYRDNNQLDEAIDMYKKYIKVFTWDEEKWYSILQIGLLSKDKNKKFKWLLNAYEFRPSRAEPLYYLAHYCQINKLYNQGYMFAKIASEISYPDDTLFVEHDVYKYKCLFELSVCSFYTNFKNEGRDACQKLLEINELPDDILKLTISNAKFYNQ
jgi:tetratricopeptide (TPR) repeat protein